jgi:glycosyltransferase involved in cell wall biosynthesis
LVSLLKAGRSTRPDICHSTSTVSNVATAIVARTAGATAIGMVQNDWDQRMARLGRGRTAIELDITPHMAINSRRAISQVARHQRRRGRELHYLPNVVDTTRFASEPRTPPSPQHLRILTIGSLTEQKRHDRAIAAAESVAAQCVDRSIELRVVGGGPLEPVLRDQAERAAATTAGLTIELVGIRRDVRPDLEWADVFLLASDFEGTPNVVLEAMAAGLPVVTTPVGDVPYFIGGDGPSIGLSAPSESALAAELIRLWQDPDRWSTSRVENRKAVESQFSMDVVIRTLIQIYDQVDPSSAAWAQEVAPADDGSDLSR